MEAKKRSNYTIGTLRADVGGDKRKFVFDGEVAQVVFKDGSVLNVADQRTYILTTPQERAAKMQELGYWTEDLAAKKLAFASEKNVKYELNAKIK